MSGHIFCFGCFDGLQRKKLTHPALEKLEPKESREVRRPSKPHVPVAPAAEPPRRRCWCCRRAKRPSKTSSMGVYSCEDGMACPTLDELDAAQRAMVMEMRSRVQKQWPKRHDLWLKRFLAHKKWNLEKAMAAYVDMEEWRRKVGADHILREYPDGKLNSVLPDKTGRLVIWMRTGHVPWWRSLFERTDEALRAQLWAGEWIYAQQAQLAKLTGIWRERAVVLVDLSDLDFNYFQGLSSCSRARRRGAQQTTAQYYPGVVDKAYLLHAPGFASRAWSAQMVSSEAEMQQMLGDLGAVNVPRSLGGTSDGPDLQLPVELMMPRKGWGEMLDAWKPREISIPARSTHHEVLVAPGGSVSWQWALVGSSITFQIQRQTGTGATESVLKPTECHFHDLEEPIFGRAMAQNPTEFHFSWDNSASHWSKKLLLRLEVWVLNQPHSLATSSEASQAQLDSFLTIQDKARERIKDSFTHLIHEVPSATHYQPQWSKLDQLPEEELLPEYVSAIQSLRQLLFTQLQGARPLQAASVAAQLRMYVDLVQKDHFSISLAKEAFEDSHVAQLCERFGLLAEEFAGDLPSLNLSAAMDLSEQSIQEQRDLIIKDFHLGDGFLRRLQQCFRKKRDELEDINQEMVLAEWQKEAESGRCFILSKLAIELPRYRSRYGAIFSKSLEAKARDFALQVQRSRVAGCVLLRHFAVPVAPWFAWPIMALYIRQGALSGILTMAVHGVVLAGIYSILQFMGRLPFYVDLDYQVLKHHPGLLEVVMKYPQIPWDLLSQFIAILGWIRVAWIIASQIFRPPETRTIGQLSNLEIKVNTLLERTEAQMKKEIITSALEAALWIDSNDPSAAALVLSTDWPHSTATGMLLPPAEPRLKVYRGVAVGPSKVARVLQDEPLPLLWTTKPSPMGSATVRLRPLKPPPRPDEEVNISASPFDNDGGMGMFWREPGQAHGLIFLDSPAQQIGSQDTGDAQSESIWVLVGVGIGAGWRQQMPRPEPASTAAPRAYSAAPAAAAPAAPAAPKPTQPAPRHRAPTATPTASSATSEAQVTPEELHDRDARQAKESEARFWSHAGEVRKATYHQARKEAAQVLQRAAQDGTLAEAISSEVALRSSGEAPDAAADRISETLDTRESAPWHLLPSVGTWLNPAPEGDRNLPAEVPEVPATYCYDNDHCDFVLCDELVDEMVEQVVASSLSWVEALLEAAESEVHTGERRPSERMPRLEPRQARPRLSSWSVAHEILKLSSFAAEAEEEAVKQVAASLLSAARSGNAQWEGETAQAAEVMKQVAASLLQAAKDGTLLRWQAEHLAQRLQRGSQVPGIGDLESPDGSERPVISRSSCSEVASLAVHDALEFAAKHLANLEDLRDDLSMSVALSQGSEDREWFLSEVAGEVTHQVMNSLESCFGDFSGMVMVQVMALVKGLVVVSQVGASDLHFAYLFEVEHRTMARTAVKNFQFPDKGDPQRCAASLKKESGKLRRCAISHEWDELIPGMVQALDKLTGTKDGARKEGTKADGRAARKLFQDADDESDMEDAPGSSCCGCCFRGCIILMVVLGGIVGAAWVLEFSSRAGLLPTENGESIGEMVIGEYGALLETWCREIETYLEKGIDEKTHIQEPGPRGELDFWRRRECKAVFNVLHAVTRQQGGGDVAPKSRQTVFNTLRRWKQIDISITEAFNEAKDHF
eukprot:s508_g29.t4